MERYQIKFCPYCAEPIEDNAVKCDRCGGYLPTDAQKQFPPRIYRNTLGGWEWKSQMTVLEVPLIHIAFGLDPVTYKPYVARGVIAIGNIAVGGLAIGSVALGWIAFGGVGVGLLGMGGLAAGIVALGGVALGIYLAAGGVAIAYFYAIGGVAIAQAVLSGLGIDAKMVEFLGQWWPELIKDIPRIK